jgi:DNA-binding MarR family transcriptional regulator
MRRKEIVLRLQDWFEVSSPAITQALRRMARLPMGLVRLVEDADSAREKRVILTPKGEEFIRTMVERGRAYLQILMEQVPEDQVSTGIEFLRAAVAAVERVHSDGG